MSSKHTPGPWEAKKFQGLWEVKTVNGRMGMDESELIPVTHLGLGVSTEANAALIAAAPELLEALETAERMAAEEGEHFWIRFAEEARALIRKARGEQA
jgi:hypothetical protein